MAHTLTFYISANCVSFSEKRDQREYQVLAAKSLSWLRTPPSETKWIYMQRKVDATFQPVRQETNKNKTGITQHPRLNPIPHLSQPPDILRHGARDLILTRTSIFLCLPTSILSLIAGVFTWTVRPFFAEWASRMFSRWISWQPFWRRCQERARDEAGTWLSLILLWLPCH